MENINATTVTVGRGRGRGRGKNSEPSLQQALISKNATDLRVNQLLISSVSNLASKSAEKDSGTIQDEWLQTEKVQVESSDEGKGVPATKHLINWGSESESPSDVSRFTDTESFTTKRRSKVVRYTRQPVSSYPSDGGEKLTNLTTQHSPSKASSTSLQSVPSVLRKPGHITIAQFLPKYFKFTKPSHHLKTLGTTEVKILKVLDKPGYLGVAFQDKYSVESFSHLLKEMAKFYTTPEGFTLRRHGQSLKNGEIVAAVVCSTSDESVFRRVKIKNIQIKEDDIVRVHAIDIDNLSHWNISNAFSLLEAFHRHPSQACQIRISNFTDLYPKGFFEVLFSNRKTFLDVMNRLAISIIESMIGHSIIVSNISIENDIVSVEVNLDVNLRLESLFVESFCSHYTPGIPEEGNMYEGVVTYVLPSGRIGICQKGSLVGPINQVLSSFDVQHAAQNVTEKDRNELFERIRSGNCRLCIAFDEKRSTLVRVQIQSFNVDKWDKFRVTFMETGRETLLTVQNLICGITNNPKIPAILALLPAQALSFQLAGSNYLSEIQCTELFQKYKSGVKFKVFKNLKVRGNPLEVKLFDSAQPL